MTPIRELDDLLCEYCCTGARRFTGPYDEKCIDCLADEFVVSLPAHGLFDGFWGESQEVWRCEGETKYALMPQTAHSYMSQPWTWEVWIEEPRIFDSTVQYLAGVSNQGHDSDA